MPGGEQNSGKDGWHPLSSECRIIQFEVFQTALGEQPAALEELKNQLLPIYIATPRDKAGTKSHFGMIKSRVSQLQNYEPAKRLLAEQRWGITLEDLLPLYEHLTAWYERNGFDKLWNWMLLIATLQLHDWEIDEARELGFSWLNQPSWWFPEFPPDKFVYTLEVPGEDSFVLSQPADEFDIHREIHPHGTRNSVLLPGDNPYSYGIPDWDPDSTESRKDAEKRIMADFKKRLRRHLNRIARHAKQDGFGRRRREGAKNGSASPLQRNVLYVYKSRVLGLSYDDLYNEYIATLQMADESGAYKKGSLKELTQDSFEKQLQSLTRDLDKCHWWGS